VHVFGRLRLLLLLRLLTLYDVSASAAIRTVQRRRKERRQCSWRAIDERLCRPVSVVVCRVYRLVTVGTTLGLYSAIVAEPVRFSRYRSVSTSDEADVSKARFKFTNASALLLLTQ
jgi:hypothetical protein